MTKTIRHASSITRTTALDIEEEEKDKDNYTEKENDNELTLCSRFKMLSFPVYIASSENISHKMVKFKMYKHD